MHISEKVKPFNCCPACGSGDIVFDEKKKSFAGNVLSLIFTMLPRR